MENTISSPKAPAETPEANAAGGPEAANPAQPGSASASAETSNQPEPDKQLPSAAGGSAGGDAAPAKGQKSFTPAQCALFSAFVYPGAGQLAGGKKGKGWTMIAVFSVFLIWWLIWLALGLFMVYRESSYFGIQYTETMAQGVSYLKLSFIPGTAAASIFVYSIYDAYKG